MGGCLLKNLIYLSLVQKLHPQKTESNRNRHPSTSSGPTLQMMPQGQSLPVCTSTTLVKGNGDFSNVWVKE